MIVMIRKKDIRTHRAFGKKRKKGSRGGGREREREREAETREWGRRKMEGAEKGRKREYKGMT
jgi:hypothetical protein